MKGISSGRGKKWSYFGGILKVESLGLADRLEVACERKWRAKTTSWYLTWTTEMGKVEDETGFSGQIAGAQFWTTWVWDVY